MRAQLGDIGVGYTVCGKGPPVVLVHGLAEDRRSWSTIQARCAESETFAYDLRGHGETDAGSGEGTLGQLAGDLERFIERLTGPARCVGYSLGGTVVLSLAATRPDLVTHAVVGGTSTVVGRAAADFFGQRIELLRSDRAAFASALRDDTAAQIVTAGADLEAITAHRLEAIGDGRGYVNAARAMQGLRETPLTPALASIRCRVDVIGGNRDQFCPRKAADIMLAALERGTYHEIADCGHLMTVDQPQRYADTVYRALSQPLEDRDG